MSQKYKWVTQFLLGGNLLKLPPNDQGLLLGHGQLKIEVSQKYKCVTQFFLGGNLLKQPPNEQGLLLGHGRLKIKMSHKYKWITNFYRPEFDFNCRQMIYGHYTDTVETK